MANAFRPIAISISVNVCLLDNFSAGPTVAVGFVLFRMVRDFPY
jgi:hypothetical protein